MGDGASEPIEAPHEDNIEASSLGVGHQPVQRWPGILGARNAGIDVFFRDLPAAALAILSKLPELHFWILTLVRGRYPPIKGHAHRGCTVAHWLNPLSG
jgi:hypothetical protein